MPHRCRLALTTFAVSLTVVLTQYAVAQHGTMPPGMSHEEHMKMMHDQEMKKRGDLAMGFDQDKVSHHFRLTADGGSIEVSVKETADEKTRDEIRDHLKTISHEFADGIFTSPIATHAEVPPGVTALRERKARVKYSYEETAGGGRVLIQTTDSAAKKAVHDFLSYQIREHATGDPISPQK